MKKIMTAAAAVSALLLCGCKETVITAEITEKPAETATASPYLLARGWEGRELLKSIYYCGEYRPLPISLDSYPDLSYSDGILTFPDGSYAEAHTDSGGNICALRFTRQSAPSDLNIYGVTLKTKPEDIHELLGAANNIGGDINDTIAYHYYEGGINELTIIFRKKVLTEIYIAV